MSKTKNLITCSLFTALAGLLLGSRKGMISVVAYMLLGLAGLPIFSEGGGIWYIFKPSFGYIIGFCLGTFVTGLISERMKEKTVPRYLLANFIGLLIVYILVLGKALTGGYIGHAVTVANHKVYQAFYSDNDRHALMHGPTFMGNALACAVALKGIEIFERENYMDKIRRIEEISRREMDGFSDPRIKEIRIMGGCTCIEVHDSKTLEGFQQFAYERGLFSRPFLKYMYAMVPYIIEENDLVKIFDTMKSWFLS